MIEKLTTYDPAEDLTSEAAIAFFMAEASKTGNGAYMTHARRVVARAKGMYMSLDKQKTSSNS